MVINTKTTSESSSRRTRSPWVANLPSFRRSALPDTPKKTSWTNIIPTTLELLTSIALSNYTECAQNDIGNIPIKSETIDTISNLTVAVNKAILPLTSDGNLEIIDTTRDDIRSSSTGKTLRIISETISDKTTVIHSTPAITQPSEIVPLQSIESNNSILSSGAQHNTSEIHTLSLTNQFKSFIPDICTQQDIADELCLALSYQFMFDKRTSPWEMKDWNQDELNDFVIQVEKIDRLYHIVANDQDQNSRSWEICCRMDYKGEKYFVEMYASCDYTGFDCQGGGHICITKLPDFFLDNMVTMDQNPNQIYKALLEDDYNVQEPDPLHKMHPKFWNNTPMLKYLCHNSIYKNKDILSHFKEQLPQVLANSVDDFIRVKEWENE